ncbi:hypothetical protein ACFQ1E_13230 [Sphingomonas canadensis]|uniref:Uncharacterized protein n=1 Tax=Sphingomonas canadensis TaxID=1219257 RepID=A0ABW3H740_9SPHN|nr:hypothetical protein [Sphingomonas canadensis]MCW3837039.1 hypothetical protein [Sphingomonas canadensis]
MLLTVVAILAPLVQAASFAPPPGRPVRVITERSDGEGEDRRTYRSERQIRFTRDGEGWRAEVRTLAGSADGGPEAQAMFSAGYGALAGRTLVFRLDAQGRATALDDQAGHWQAFCDGVKTLIAMRRGKASPEAARMLADRVAAPLCALPADRQFATLASMVEQLAGGEAVARPGTRPAALSAVSPFGGPVAIQGTQTIAFDGLLVVSTTRGAADMAGPDGTSGRVEIERVRRLDPLTGLLTGTSETIRTSTGARASVRRSEVRVRIEPEDAWR